MSFLLGYVAGLVSVVIIVVIWWYCDAGLVTGILDDDILMQRPESDWTGEDDRE